METAAPDDVTPWWGTYALDEETGGRWHIGPSTLWLYRSGHDWRIVYRPSSDASTTDPMAPRSAATVPVPDAEIEDILRADDPLLETSRYSFRRTERRVSLSPALADRPVIARPEHPLFVPPGEAVTIYVNTAVWVRIELAKSQRLLREMPAHRMSDTWFGASTREGTFCYATRTTGRLRLDRLSLRLHRAVTPLHIHNRADDALALERVQLPVQHLAVYRAPTDTLWTNAVSMKRTASTEGAAVSIKAGPPDAVPDAVRVQEPRESDQRGLFTSTFSAVGALFSS